MASSCVELERFSVDEGELGSTTKRLEIAGARALVSYIATRELSITGSEVAGRFKVDRSAVSRAAQRVGKDPEVTLHPGIS